MAPKDAALALCCIAVLQHVVVLNIVTLGSDVLDVAFIHGQTGSTEEERQDYAW